MQRVQRLTKQLMPEPVAGSSHEVVIVSACRTPLGSFNGSLGKITCEKLGAAVMTEALVRAKLEPSVVEECFMGNVLSAGIGQAPARQAALAAGLPTSVPCTTVNKVCSSGLKSVMLAAQQIQLGQADCVLAGGMESMTNVPFYLPKARFGMKYGNGAVLDGLAHDGLTDPYEGYAMGVCGEVCAKTYDITRTDQDDYAEQSYRRAQQATLDGSFKAEIVPIQVGKKLVSEDDECTKVDFAKLRKLRPAFQKEAGTVTAGNASAISDGAAAMVLMSASKAASMGGKPLARVLAYADAAKAPVEFTTAPTLAINKALQRAGLSLDQIDLFEINEAFSVVALANQKLLGLDAAKVNVWGGAVSIGHPLGASGARILVTLLHALKAKNGRYGVAGICNGGGGASAMVVELL